MGKRKRLLARAVPAHERALALYDDVARYHVSSIYDLPVPVLWYHRAVRLRGRA